MNDIWEADNMPSIWKLANIIPIPKPGKDHSEPSNYWHITLASCVCYLNQTIYLCNINIVGVETYDIEILCCVVKIVIK